MKVIDPGHRYELSRLDGDGAEALTFVKREGAGYPGNFGHHSGTNLQEVLRAMIHRAKYLDEQIPHWRNKVVVSYLRSALENLEFRAAERHGRILRLNRDLMSIEAEAFCSRCGHIGCQGQSCDRP